MATERNERVDEFIAGLDTWSGEVAALREIALAAGLTEGIKWGQPCYMTGTKNVALIGNFKDYCSLSFFKGALLSDPDGVLQVPGKNTQSARLVKFSSVAEIQALRSTIESLLTEAVAITQDDKQVEFKATADYEVPVELTERLADSAELTRAWQALTPGRQRGYLLHFGGAKQAATRYARIDKYAERILSGKGMQDCVCGRSTRMPRCDGSHNNA